jgi:hypothetical protein
MFGYEHALANFHDFLSMPGSFYNLQLRRGHGPKRSRFGDRRNRFNDDNWATSMKTDMNLMKNAQPVIPT